MFSRNTNVHKRMKRESVKYPTILTKCIKGTLEEFLSSKGNRIRDRAAGQKTAHGSNWLGRGEVREGVTS